MPIDDFLDFMKQREEARFTSGKPGRKPNLEGVHFEFSGGISKIFYQGKEIGSLEIRQDRMAENTAKRMFPEQTKKEDQIYRVQGIQIEDEYQGRGWGLMLYLYGYNQFPNTKFYNSQAWEPAILTLNRLKQENWVELFWQGQMGGVHISWLTPSGKAKAEELEQLKPKQRTASFPKKALKKRSLRPKVVDEYNVKMSDDPNLFNQIVDLFKLFPGWNPNELPHFRHGSIMDNTGEYTTDFVAVRGPSEDEERTGVFFGTSSKHITPEMLLNLMKQDPRAAEYFV